MRLTGALAWYWIENGRLEEARRALGDALTRASATLLDEARGSRRTAFVIEGLAATSLLNGRAHHAARLRGTAAALRATAAGSAPPAADQAVAYAAPGCGVVDCDPVDGPQRTDLGENERVAAAVRAALGEEEFAAEFARGRSQRSASSASRRTSGR